MSSTDSIIHDRYFPEAWQVVLLVQRTKSGASRAGFFFRKDDGSMDSVERDVDAKVLSHSRVDNLAPGSLAGEPSLCSTANRSPHESGLAGKIAGPTPRPEEQKAPSAPDVSEHWRRFGLSRNPFEPSSNPEFMYWSEQHKNVLTELIGCVTNRKGVAVLMGEAGVGKSMLIASLGDRLAAGRIEFGLLLNSRVTVDQFYKMLAYDFALDRTGGAKAAVLNELTKLGVWQAGRGLTMALMVDEAHSLPGDVLEEIRLLDNLQAGNVKLLQIVLAGQPALESMLEAAEQRNFKQRVILRCKLNALCERDTCACIMERFAKAGLDRQEVFPAEVLREIHCQSQGIPRVMNTVCDNLLRACADSGLRAATVELLAKIGSELQLEPSRPAVAGD